MHASAVQVFFREYRIKQNRYWLRVRHYSESNKLFDFCFLNRSIQRRAITQHTFKKNKRKEIEIDNVLPFWILIKEKYYSINILSAMLIYSFLISELYE